MTIVGNLCIGLAALLYLVPLQFIYQETHKRNDGWATLGILFTLVPLWLLLGAGLAIATSKGSMDWIHRPRGQIYLLVGLTTLALFFVTFFSLLGKFEAPSQMPASTRPFVGWAARVFPILVFGFLIFALNPPMAQSINGAVYRAPFAIVSGIALIAGLALGLEWMIHSARDQATQYEGMVEAYGKRDRDMIARIESITAEKNFSELIRFSNRYEKPQIRELALAKAKQRADFTEELVRMLTEYDPEGALIYLDACEPPDPSAVAEPVRLAILLLADMARKSIANAHTLYPDQFDSNTRRMLSVVAKLKGQGVDYLPAIRAYRAALDEPHFRKIDFSAMATLDKWIAKKSKS